RPSVKSAVPLTIRSAPSIPFPQMRQFPPFGREVRREYDPAGSKASSVDRCLTCRQLQPSATLGRQRERGHGRADSQSSHDAPAEGDRLKTVILVGEASLVGLITAEKVKASHAVVSRLPEGVSHQDEANRQRVAARIASRLVEPLGVAVTKAVPGGNRATVEPEEPQA